MNREVRTTLRERRGLVTAREAATRAGVQLWSVLRWARLGHVEAVWIGSHPFIRLSSLVRHLGRDASKLLGLLDSRGRIIRRAPRKLIPPKSRCRTATRRK